VEHPLKIVNNFAGQENRNPTNAARELIRRGNSLKAKQQPSHAPQSSNNNESGPEAKQDKNCA